MSFFKDLKDDGAKDIVMEESMVKPEESEDLFAVEAPAEENISAVQSDENIGDVQEASLVDEYVDESLLENLFDENSEADVDEADEEYELEEEKPAGAASDTDEQITVITKGTTINGSIVSDCSLNVMGTINGDIECIGKLTISGNVVGNSVASDVYVNAKRLDGNIDSEGSVKIGLGTVVIGDIKAASGVIAGAVKGEVDIAGPIVIDSTAIIKGNIKAKSVQMNNGAVVEGFCSLSYASVDIDDIFE